MSSVFTPLINRMVAETDDNDQLTKLMTRVGRYQAILYLWVWGGFLILGRFFIDKWAGHDFADTYWMILIMTAPLFIPLVQNTGIEIQRAKNRHKARSVAYLCMAFVNIVLTVVLALALAIGLQWRVRCLCCFRLWSLYELVLPSPYWTGRVLFLEADSESVFLRYRCDVGMPVY